MPQPYNYTVAQPGVSGYFDAMRQGRTDRLAVEQDRRNDALARYLPDALSGNADAQQQAMASASPDQMIQLKQAFGAFDDRKMAMMREYNGTAASLAQWADTPDKWATGLAMLRERFPDLHTQDPPFEMRGAIIARAQSAADMIDQTWKERQFGLQSRVAEANIRQSDAAAAASRAAAARTVSGNVDPNSGRRIAPAGVQGRDTAQLQKYEQNADSFAGIAATLQSARRSLEKVETGPGADLARIAASPFAALGVPSATEFVADYDAIDQAAKTAGIEKLKGIGGSDTERELLVAIQTGLNTTTPSKENARRFDDAIAAADIASRRAQLATEWLNRHGSLTYTAPNGMSWPQFWSAYQKAAWQDHLKARETSPTRNYRDEQRQLLQGRGGAAMPPPPPGFEVR